MKIRGRRRLGISTWRYYYSKREWMRGENSAYSGPLRAVGIDSNNSDQLRTLCLSPSHSLFRLCLDKWTGWFISSVPDIHFFFFIVFESGAAQRTVPRNVPIFTTNQWRIRIKKNRKPRPKQTFYVIYFRKKKTKLAEYFLTIRF